MPAKTRKVPLQYFDPKKTSSAKPETKAVNQLYVAENIMSLKTLNLLDVASRAINAVSQDGYYLVKVCDIGNVKLEHLNCLNELFSNARHLTFDLTAQSNSY